MYTPQTPPPHPFQNQFNANGFGAARLVDPIFGAKYTLVRALLNSFLLFDKIPYVYMQRSCVCICVCVPQLRILIFNVCS